MAIVILFVGTLVFLAHLFSALFEKTRIPDVLPLVFLGLWIGPIMNVVTPDAFGKAGHAFTTISLVIMLFQGGLELNFASLRESTLPGIWLTAVSFFGTLFSVALLSLALFGLSILEGLMLGAILGGTSAAVVIPLLKKLPLEERPRTILFLESSFSDVLCIVVTLALLQAIAYDELRPVAMLTQIWSSFSLAAILGAIGAIFWSIVLSWMRHLENSIFTTPAFVFIIYGVTELLGYSGAIASLTFGIILGNVHGLPLALTSSLRPIELNQTEKAFFSEIVFLLKTFFFVYIGLSIRLTNFLPILGGLVLTIVIFAIRIPAVRLGVDRSVRRFDAMMASVMVPKGLAAAVLASMPLQAGIEKGSILQDATYAVILFSIILTSVLTFLVERGWIGKPYTKVFSTYRDGAPSEEFS